MAFNPCKVSPGQVDMIKVRWQHLKLGVCRHLENCPLALALKEAFKPNFVRVSLADSHMDFLPNPDKISFSTDHNAMLKFTRTRIYPSYKVALWVNAFDNELKLAPCIMFVQWANEESLSLMSLGEFYSKIGEARSDYKVRDIKRIEEELLRETDESGNRFAFR